MVHFAKLTMSTDKPVYINCEMVSAVFEMSNQNTLVQFSGDDDLCIQVKESVEKTMDIIYDAMQE